MKKILQQYTVEISLYSITQSLLILGGIWLALQLREMILLLILGFIISAGITIASQKIKKTLSIPYKLGVILVMTLIIGVFSVILSVLIPSITQEFDTLVQNFPQLVDQMNQILTSTFNIPGINIQTYIQENATLSSYTWDVISGIFFTTRSVISVIAYTVFFLLAIFFMSFSPKSVDRLILFFTPDDHKSSNMSTLKMIRKKIGLWIIGQLIISIIITLVSYTILLILGVPYALLLSIVSGFFNLIPFIGPFLSLFPAVFFALFISLQTALLVALLYIGVQQIDGNFLTPLIMKQVTGLSSIVIILSILIGTALAGALGAILAIPIATTLSIFFPELEEITT